MSGLNLIRVLQHAARRPLASTRGTCLALGLVGMLTGPLFAAPGPDREREPFPIPASATVRSSWQEEVHRFAIDYHRKLRDKRPLGSVLDGIPGVGPARRNALLARFGSVENIRAATAEALGEVPGISPSLAEAIRQYFVDIPPG